MTLTRAVAQAHRELDRAVALALDWTECGCSNPECDWWNTPAGSCTEVLPHYSTDIAAAMSLVEHAYWYSLEKNVDSGRHECTLLLERAGITTYAAADEIPEAIVKAFLAAAAVDAGQHQE